MPLFTTELNRIADSIGASDLTVYLHTVAPTNTSPATGRTNSGGGSYESGATLAATDISNAANGDFNNDVAVDFGTATADVGTVVAYSVYRGSAAVGYSTLPSTVIASGDGYAINANSMNFNGATA